ncbi:MAG: chitin synthase activator (Chs3) [Lasallia pustulata]|uniref:Chitin synthase activator (Chs3) n=1 Tax=Lasallia pustulata TaxID=136370 RepID=A0A5M8PRN3_9LECA|nr:MAG: chitin synthase activator (Chs3) [Lasallia pustulata]
MSHRRGQLQPQLGATFVPGGVDDFYIPELISPAPQRIMPEVPENIQENLAHLELEANSTNRLSGLQSPAPMKGYGPQENMHLQNHGLYDQPNFSPFPQLRNRPSNVPPSDDEYETILERARLPVLNSNDAEMQLTWAQDALSYVEVAGNEAMRTSENQAPRAQTPRVEHQLRVDAMSVVSFLAEQHHPKAEFIRGMWLEFGKFGLRMDKKEAYWSFMRAAQNGYGRAEYRMGMQFESSNDIAKAIKHYTLGVEAKDSASHYRMGMMMLLGQHGQVQDYERGIQLIRFAAETADENAPQGAFVLGMLQAGELPQVEVPENFLQLDVNAARINVERAAYLGFPKAQAKMGAAYELCNLGCEFDPVLSMHYNALAARRGEAEAEMAISKWFLCGHEGAFQKNEEMAFTYARRAALNGFPTAEFAMGYFYEVGIYIPADLKEARIWYDKASGHGNKDAAARLDGIARSKTLSKKDHEEVAVAKIKSQYGSQRGKRPQRFGNVTPMPSISDVSGNTSQSNSRQSGAGHRPQSAAPYPIEDRPGSQPASIASYSGSDGQRPRPLPGNLLGYNGAQPRPGSAFGINPNLRPISAHGRGSIPPLGSYGGLPGGQVETHRPYPGIENSGAGRGGMMPAQRIIPVGQGLQGYGQPTGALPNQSKAPKPGGDTSQPSSPRLDIGFSAPLDPSGADRKKRLQRSDNPARSVPRPPTTNLGAKGPPDRNAARTPTMPHSQTLPNLRSSSPHHQNGRAGSSEYPSRQESLPAFSNSPFGRTTNRPIPPPKLASTTAAPTPPPASTSSTVNAPNRPPGKGPKTFEEMGVPQGKSDSDCALM